MKRVLVLFVIIAMIMALCPGCALDTSNGEAGNDSQYQSSAESDVESDVESSSKSESSKPQKKPVTSNGSSSGSDSRPQSDSLDKDSSKQSSSEEQTPEDIYKKIVGRKLSANEMTTIRIKDNKTGLVLQMKLPKDWKLSKADNQTFDIKRNGKKIGTLTSKAVSEEKDVYEERYAYDETKGIDIDWNIVYKKENGKDNFYRKFYMKGYYDEKKYTVNMSVDYAELNKSAADNMVDSAKTIVPDREFTTLSETNGSKKILILGNSFIGSSQIGATLNDMLDTANNGYSVNAVSIGMAEIDTYISNDEICDEIMNGEYCYVFQCGFYSQNAIEDFSVIKDICDNSNTSIVIFPAHNESENIINLSFERYKDVPLLNWKGGVQALINKGVAEADMCVNDVHKHSTPLAGYVGAYMIYKTLFGEEPPAVTSQAPLTPEYVNFKLSAYKDVIGLVDEVVEETYEIN